MQILCHHPEILEHFTHSGTQVCLVLVHIEVLSKLVKLSGLQYEKKKRTENLQDPSEQRSKITRLMGVVEYDFTFATPCL